MCVHHGICVEDKRQLVGVLFPLFLDRSFELKLSGLAQAPLPAGSRHMPLLMQKITVILKAK